jgi:hypothetical protein
MWVAGAAWEGLVSEAVNDGWKSVLHAISILLAISSSESYTFLDSGNFSLQLFEFGGLLSPCGRAHHLKLDSDHIQLEAQTVTLHVSNA